jgi:TIR domain-containing protein
MVDAGIALDATGRTVVQVIYDLFRERSKWPKFAVLDVRLDRSHHIDAHEALKAIAMGYVRTNRLATVLNDQDDVELTLLGIATAQGSAGDIETLTRFVQWVARREQAHDGDESGQRLVVTSDEAAAELGLDLAEEDGLAAARRLWFMVDLLPTIRSGASFRDDELWWQMTISREVRQFRDLSGPEDLVRRAETYWRRADAVSLGRFPGSFAGVKSVLDLETTRPSAARGSPETASPAAGSTASAESLLSESNPATTGPSVFISYAHEDGELVTRLGSALRARGCRVWIDREGMRVGDRLIDRIAGAIDEVDFLLAIVSEASVKSPWCKRELSLAMSGEFEKAHIKVLPVRLGSVVLPPTLKDVYSPRVERDDIEAMADKLVGDMTSHDADRAGPPTPPSPAPTATPTTVPAAPANPPTVAVDEPIKILGIDEAHVGRPRNDGTRGSALYSVPLRLNRRPSEEWAEIFRAVWDHPPQFTTMHRPGIASVSGDRIILEGTTVDEIERYHAETLRHVIPEVGRRLGELESRQRAEREREAAVERTHEDAVREAARRISFE